MAKVEVGDFLVDKVIYNIYVKQPINKIGFEQVCNAIDTGGGQTCDVNGVLKSLDEAGYRISSK